MVSDSDTFLIKMKSMLEDFIIEAKKEIRPEVVHTQKIQIGRQTNSSTLVVFGEMVKKSQLVIPRPYQNKRSSKEYHQLQV